MRAKDQEVWERRTKVQGWAAWSQERILVLGFIIFVVLGPMFGGVGFLWSGVSVNSQVLIGIGLILGVVVMRLVVVVWRLEAIALDTEEISHAIYSILEGRDYSPGGISVGTINQVRRLLGLEEGEEDNGIHGG